MRKILTTVALGFVCLSFSSLSHASSGKKVDGYTVNICDFHKYYSEEDQNDNSYKFDFCSQRATNAYKKFGEKDINFNKKYVLVKMDNFYFAAVNPKTKQVFAIPSAITNFEQTKTGKITFSKFDTKVCSFGNDVIFNSLSPSYYYSVETTEGHKICYEFDEKEGFGESPVVYDLKTDKPVASF